MSRVLAIDIGSSSARAVAYDDSARPSPGRRRKIAYAIQQGRGGTAELDAAQVASAVTQAAEPLLGRGIEMVAISSFWHSLLALDRRGGPLTPILTWQDTRAAEQASALARRLDARAVHERTGCPLHPSFWPAKLLWLREQEPGLFRSAARFCSFGDYLWSRLGGSLATTLSIASGTGLLLRDGSGWDGELLETLGIGPESLPRLEEQPLERDGCIWLPPLGDGACANLGAGAVGRERAALSLGTSGALRVLHDDDGRPPRPGLFRYRLDAARVVEGGSLSDGGNLLAWLRGILHPREPLSALEQEPGAGGVVFLPLLGGERSPGWRGEARGAVSGLSLATGPEQLVQAVLEGIALRFAQVLERLPGVKALTGVGEALEAVAGWPQLLADALGLPLAVPEDREASARGAAVFALERLGVDPPEPAIEARYEPRPERVERYLELRERQHALYEALLAG
ncbi:MAG: gluconokinase [Gaiellaceae bacterium]